MPKAGLVFQKKDEYMTPKDIVDFFGPFDYDPATTDKQAKQLGIKKYDTIKSNGLNTDWSKFDKIWINPPFTHKFDFLEKAINTNSHIFFLMPIETMTTNRFHKIMENYRGGTLCGSLMEESNSMTELESASLRRLGQSFWSYMVRKNVLNIGA